MRKAILVLGVLLPLAACIPAKIVEADGPRVTFAWSSADTSLDRVYSLAINYCDGWNAPPQAGGRHGRRAAAHLDLRLRAAADPAVRTSRRWAAC